MMYQVPFKTPVDYFIELLLEKPENINNFKELYDIKTDWHGKYDCDLHIYPYIKAVPSALSFGCPNTCSFCPTAKYYNGMVYRGDPEVIIPKYKDLYVHFMDENFFYNDMDIILPLMKKNNIKWLAMSDYKSTLSVFKRYGDKYLYECGLVCVEIGLENICLMKKIGEEEIPSDKVSIYYLNMVMLEGETINTIKQNSFFMSKHKLKNPIHFNNGTVFGAGQWYYPYGEEKKGIMLPNKYARTSPTFIPESFLNESFTILSLKKANYYSQLIYGIKLFPEEEIYNVKDFIENNPDKVKWLVTGIRCGAII